MKGIIFVLFSFFVLSSFAQSDNKHSIGVDAGFLSPVNKEITNNFYYGTFFLMSEKVFHRIKLSIEINYSSISWYALYHGLSFIRNLKEYQFDTEYLNFPFIISFIRVSPDLDIPFVKYTKFGGGSAYPPK